MRWLFLIVVFMFLILNVCALKITEIESNPAGIDSGNEWIELYNDGEINLEEYKLVNNDGGEILLNRTISGYFVYILGKQWLDNTDEKISLYKNGELIDETDIFDDTTNNDMTWQLCDDWEFKNSTKGEENSCEAPEEEPQETPSENTEELAKEEPEENFEENQSQTKERETIVLNPLNPQVIKTEEDKKGISKNYALYGFVAFCILIGILFIIKNIKNRKYKNEFR